MSIKNTRSVHQKRTYRSPLREEQAAATRDRILEGLARTMANGVEELSVPAVAREAGVSVATVYRHFPNKGSLLTGLTDYFGRQSGMDRQWELPTTWDELDGIIRRLYGAYERFDDVTRAAIVSRLGQRAKQEQLPARIAFSRSALANLAPGLDDAALERVNRLALVLVSSSAFQMYQALGLNASEAADHAVWAIRSVIAAEEQDR